MLLFMAQRWDKVGQKRTCWNLQRPSQTLTDRLYCPCSPSKQKQWSIYIHKYKRPSVSLRFSYESSWTCRLNFSGWVMLLGWSSCSSSLVTSGVQRSLVSVWDHLWLLPPFVVFCVCDLVDYFVVGGFISLVLVSSWLLCLSVHWRLFHVSCLCSCWVFSWVLLSKCLEFCDLPTASFFKFHQSSSTGRDWHLPSRKHLCVPALVQFVDMFDVSPDWRSIRWWFTFLSDGTSFPSGSQTKSWETKGGTTRHKETGTTGRTTSNKQTNKKQKLRQEETGGDEWRQVKTGGDSVCRSVCRSVVYQTQQVLLLWLVF